MSKILLHTFRVKISIVSILIVFVANYCSQRPASKDVVYSEPVILVYAKEPPDSSNYTHLKYSFYRSKTGRLCERKLAVPRDSTCNCDYEVFYDSVIKAYENDDELIKPLDSVVDIASFVWLDSTEYSRDKNAVYYYFSTSCGGVRSVVDMADPKSFRRLCEYRWGIDKNNVFYENDVVPGVNLKRLVVLYSPDTTNHFVEYIKDDRHVFYTDKLVEGADAASFHLVSGKDWDAEDRFCKYKVGERVRLGVENQN
jgi:hypothetical protein